LTRFIYCNLRRGSDKRSPSISSFSPPWSSFFFFFFFPPFSTGRIRWDFPEFPPPESIFCILFFSRSGASFPRVSPRPPAFQFRYLPPPFDDDLRSELADSPACFFLPIETPPPGALICFFNVHDFNCLVSGHHLSFFFLLPRWFFFWDGVPPSLQKFFLLPRSIISSFPWLFDARLPFSPFLFAYLFQMRLRDLYYFRLLRTTPRLPFEPAFPPPPSNSPSAAFFGKIVLGRCSFSRIVLFFPTDLCFF